MKLVELAHFGRLTPIDAFQTRYQYQRKKTIDVFNQDFNDFFEVNEQEDQNNLNQTLSKNTKIYNLENLNLNLLKMSYQSLRISTTNFLKSIKPEKVDLIKLEKFVERIYCEYNFIPYHNFAHGVSVMQIFNLFVKESKKTRDLFDKNHIFVASLACLAHDTAHFAKNNAYCLNKKNKLALKAFNKSILEKMHIKKTLYILEEKESSIFKDYSDEEVALFRETIIETIIGTDMSLHFEMIDRFKKTKIEDFKKNDNMLTAYVAHSGDIGNFCLEYYNYIDWAKVVAQEFHSQTIAEAKNGLKVTSFMIYTGFAGLIKDQINFGG